MSVATLPPWNVNQPPPFPVWRFTVDEFHRMIAADVLTENDRVELLEGWIVPKMVHNPPHDATIEIVNETLNKQIPAGWRIRIQSAITTDDSEPEPDLAVVVGPVRDHVARHPMPKEIAIVIEVADSSLEHDRTAKGRVYARAGIAVYWIVNLVGLQIEVYTDPTGPVATPVYRRQQTYSLNDSVPLEMEGRQLGQIAVRELLP